jgi:arylsulfatase
MKNIIFIMADQLAAKWLGCYGSDVPSTPSLDRLAAQGMRFDRCYATFPVCAPNRATALTGRSPVVHGITTNNYVLRTDMPTYAHVLRRQGYRTGGFGKFHQTPMHMPVPDSLDYLGFDEAVVSEDPKWGPWTEWIKREHPEYYDAALAVAWPFWPNHPAPEDVSRAKRARNRILVPLMARSLWPVMYPSPLPPELHDTTFITDRGLDFIDRHRVEHPDEPFFCHISYVDPHDPYDPPEPYASRFEPADMPAPLPAEWIDEGIQALAKAQRFWRFDQVWHNPDVVAHLRALYHGSLRLIDQQIGRLVTYLHANGLWEDTVLVFTTDHGEMLGDHGLMTKGPNHYDAGIRVPLIVAGGGVAAGVSDRLTSTLDFFPSFCDWAGVEAQQRPPLEGRSLAPVSSGEPDPAPWGEVSVATGAVRSVLTDDGWRLTRFVAEDKGQLFDLNADPDEQVNLYASPQHTERRQWMLERLVAVESRPAQFPQYRTLPVDGGHIWLAGSGHGHHLMEGAEVYPAPPSPHGRG